MSNEAEYVLRTSEERGIKFIRLWFTDVLGFLKSITITAQELETVLDEGEGFDGSAIEGFARIQEADMVARPDPSTFQIVPWRSETGVARMFCDVHDPDGSPFDGDPRASYLLVSDGVPETQRVTYDIERAVREIEESGHPAASEIAEIYRSGRPSSKPLGA